MMKTNWIIPLLCLTVGFAAGFSQSDFSSETSGSIGSVPRESSSSANSDSRQAGAGTKDGWSEEFTKQLKSIGFLPSRVQRNAELSKLLASLSLPELRRASELLDQLPKSFRREAQLLFALRFLEFDPQEAAKFVENHDDGGDLPYYFWKAWQPRDPETALSWFGQLSGKVDSRRLFPRQVPMSYALRDWASKEPQRAAELVMSSPAHFSDVGVEAVFEAWAKQNPKEAMERAIAIDNSLMQQTAMSAVLKNWTKQDPESAFQWYQHFTDEVLRNQLAEGIAVGLAVQNRAQSIELLHSLPDGRVRDSALARVAQSICKTALEESLELVREIPFEPGNAALKSYYEGLYSVNSGAAFSSLLQRLNSVTDPDERQAVGKFLQDSMRYPFLRADEVANAVLSTPGTAADPVRLDILERAAVRWAGENTTAARKWLESLPPGDTRNRATVGVTYSWALYAQAEASAWIDQQPPSASRDAAVSGYVKAILGLGRDPAEPLALLRTMRDPSAQLATLTAGWKDWTWRDRTAAEAWLNNSTDLTSAERAALNANRLR